MNKVGASEVNRRAFLKSTSVTAGLTILAAGSARSYAANEKLHVGVFGCGGRGPWIGDLFQKNTKSKVVAVYDYFRDRTELAAKQLGVDASRQYVGLDGYREMLSSDVDAVAVISPPYFHPEQVTAALDVGKHVYLAKPIAVDVPGCVALVEAGKKIADKLTFLVDFQTRATDLYIEAAKRVHDGMIGAPVCGQCFYHTGRLGKKSEQGTETARLRNWVFDKTLSGDIIVEQNIHVLDVANWFIGAHPVKAHGYGGRKARVDVGDCWDHFVVTYHYPNDVLLDFSSTQFNVGFNDLCVRIYGSQGTVDSHYGGQVSITAKADTWPGGSTESIYKDGAVKNIVRFHESIVSGKPITNIEESAQSTMTAILGRMAAYKGATVTWDEMIAANEKLDAHLDLPKDGPDSKPVLS